MVGSELNFTQKYRCHEIDYLQIASKFMHIILNILHLVELRQSLSYQTMYL